MNSKANGDNSAGGSDSFELSDNIQLIYEDKETESDINWQESGKENNKTKEEDTRIIGEIGFHVSSDDCFKNLLSSSPSSSANSYKDRMIGKLKKLEKPVLGHHRLESDSELTLKNIKTLQIMGSIQLGIHHTIGSLASKPERDLLMKDFMLVESTTFAADGSHQTPAHNYSQFVFKTYAPIAFRYFRELFGIPTEEYLLSFCKNPLNELSNCGSSRGSIFYVTNDDKFIMKTIQNRECNFLQKLLPGYYLNLHQNPKTLLPKFFGLYCYKCETRKIRLIAMNNVLPCHIKLHKKYDLKGSTYKRRANKKLRSECELMTYKDLDFMQHYQDGLYLDEENYNELMKTIQRDCRVLESFKIIDYSLLLGIHILDKDKSSVICDGVKNTDELIKKSGNNNNTDPCKINTNIYDKYMMPTNSTDSKFKQNQNKNITLHFHEGIPAKTIKGEKLLIFIGIIDILQSYRLAKKIEHSWKSILHNGDTVSVHNPAFYSQRFQKFLLSRVFKKPPGTPKSKYRTSGKIKVLPPPAPD